MNLRKMFYLFLVIPILFVQTGCKDEDNPVTPPETVNEAEVLVKYLEANGDFINTAAPAMIKADLVNSTIATNPNDIVVIDIRSATDYSAGHIKNAVNVAAGDVLNYYESNNLSSKATVVIACYTGQTAGWVTSLLRLMGYNNVYDLKWGMCSWNPQTAVSWPSNISNSKATQLVQTATAKPAKGSLPELNTGKTEGADILRARVEAVFAEGFGAAKITNGDVFANTSNYFIVNYWAEADYNWGHIPGAMQYTPKASLKLDTGLKTIATDKPVVVYCYTGQTSAHVAAFLRVLGYDAKSLLFGMNSMAYDGMPGTKWAEDQIHEYDLFQ